MSKHLIAKLCQSNGEITQHKLTRAALFPTAIYWRREVWLHTQLGYYYQANTYIIIDPPVIRGVAVLEQPMTND
ncbi:hypothetical protein [Cylindrospermum sp. FACHB-282]|uniref:hypothetical protein n=1 Tax=Cylindrospermum sp. FACHB-282 TaxID=2692794 RepID=UPI001686955A|nr:hypothetical protein [Cylindrospermum sp. FACHB-282]MBD2388810.1 hypothetical protein [Cylindrospermum sp. FACHB-282]